VALEVWQVALIALVMTGACALQSAAGFGSALVAAPILVLVDAVFVPVPMLLSGLVLASLMALRDLRGIDVRGVAWALGGRVPGSIAAAWLLTVLPASLLSPTFAWLILAGVLLTALGPRIAPSPSTSFAAGVLSGVMGTITSAGGPPMALLHQRAEGPALRGTLSSYFVVSSLISLAVLSAIGKVGQRELLATLWLVPFTVLGFLVARPARVFLDQGRTRPAVLAISALSALLVLLQLSGCSGDGASALHPDAATAASEDSGSAARDSGAVLEEESPLLFDADRVLDVEIELDPADWESLRYEGRALAEIFGGCSDQSFSYTWYPASVTVEGETLAQVTVRKKGLLGSLSAARPSLKLDFAELDPGQRLLGSKRMTLNNDKQDPSHTHQCASYRLFADAGVPAPRCNLARVVVNGRDLGIYSHVEEIKKPLLRRELGDDSGRLYEGQGSDLAAGFLERFEFKSEPLLDDRSALAAAADALLVPDATLLETLDPLVPLDAFFRFWAMESLVGHWDGYSGDLNNFYIYEAPGSGLHFIPWGTDGSFSREHPFLPNDIPQSVLAWARLPSRLYGHEAGRARYADTLQELLDTVWDEDAVLAQLDRVQALIGSDADPAALQTMRAFVNGRRAELETELAGGPPDWNVPPRNPPSCDDRSTPISATFDTTWGTLADALPAPGNDLQGSLGGSAPSFAAVLARAGLAMQNGRQQPAVRVVGALADGSVVVAQVSFGPAPFEVGTTRLHGTETSGFVATGTPPNVRGIGLIGDGSITLEAASMTVGGAVRGNFEARFVPLASRVFEP
jgi:uncharacterized membrane protein YfcA